MAKRTAAPGMEQRLINFLQRNKGAFPMFGPSHERPKLTCSAQAILAAQTPSGISFLLLYNHRRRNPIYITMPSDLLAVSGLPSLSFHPAISGACS